MLYSEAAKIREEIVKLRHNAPADKGARRISRDVMRALKNEREDAAYILECGKADLATDYEISERLALRMQEALKLAHNEAQSEIEEISICM